MWTHSTAPRIFTEQKIILSQNKCRKKITLGVRSIRSGAFLQCYTRQSCVTHPKKILHCHNLRIALSIDYCNMVYQTRLRAKDFCLYSKNKGDMSSCSVVQTYPGCIIEKNHIMIMSVFTRTTFVFSRKPRVALPTSVSLVPLCHRHLLRSHHR